MKGEKKLHGKIEELLGIGFVNRKNKFFQYIRSGCCFALIVFEFLILFGSLRGTIGDIPRWIPVLGVEVVFTISIVLNTFVCQEFRQRIVCYIVDFLAQFALTLLSSGLNSYLCYVYLLILTEFYISNERLWGNIVMVSASLIVYLVTYGVSANWLGGRDVVGIVAACLGDFTVILFHFFIMNLVLNAYDTKRKMTEFWEQLDESDRKLQKAYDELAEVAVLQERQRIARDIHDTAGHSITTVIMQTEAAKLAVESDPQEAKRKIVAANLQAKNALKELRECVHLLAGEQSESRLKDDLEQILLESCDGTDIVVRREIEDVACSYAKRRFLCNALKEGIANGLRHGHATAFYFELRVDDGEICFLLSDNGAGADMQKLEAGFGMKSLRLRAEQYGGSIDFASFPDEGFEVRIRVPADRFVKEGVGENGDAGEKKERIDR